MEPSANETNKAVRAWISTKCSIPETELKDYQVLNFVKHSPEYPWLVAALTAAKAAIAAADKWDKEDEINKT